MLSSYCDLSLLYWTTQVWTSPNLFKPYPYSLQSQEDFMTHFPGKTWINLPRATWYYSLSTSTYICSHTNTLTKCSSILAHPVILPSLKRKSCDWSHPFPAFSETCSNKYLLFPGIFTPPFSLTFPGLLNLKICLLLLPKLPFSIPSSLLLWTSHHWPDPNLYNRASILTST